MSRDSGRWMVAGRIGVELLGDVPDDVGGGYPRTAGARRPTAVGCVVPADRWPTMPVPPRLWEWSCSAKFRSPVAADRSAPVPPFRDHAGLGVVAAGSGGACGAGTGSPFCEPALSVV